MENEAHCIKLGPNHVQLLEEFAKANSDDFTAKSISSFLNDSNNEAFVVVVDHKIVSFAYGCTLNRPDGKKMFYLHSIDTLKEYRNQGYGTKLMQYVINKAKKNGCYKVFLITNKANKSACCIYEKNGGIAKNDDDVVYEYTF